MAVALKEGRIIRDVEAVAERPDGSRVPFIPYPTALRDAEGRIVGGINMLVDISARKEAETRQRMLIDELNHRVKNTLATVQSLAGQTARYATDLHDFTERFEARLMALARAHDLLTKRRWEGADLQGLVLEILAPYGGAPGRLGVEGPAIDLVPRTVLSLTMALHELTTNSAKYGALSLPSGTLQVCWKQPRGPDRILTLEWIERGGPEVVTPVRRGFGTRLVTRCVERDLDGELDLRYEPSGVRCIMSFPLLSRADT